MTAVTREIPLRRRPRLGFLGAGWIGRMRMQAVAVSDTAEVCAIADSAEQALAEAARIAPGAELLVNLGQLLACELDGLVIATPSALHAGQAIAALKAGTAVFCQKPVGRSANEVGEVIHAARQADRLLASDFVYRFTHGMQAIRDLIRRGDLGRVYAAELCFHNSYGPDKPWYYNAALSGGGCVIDLGTHLVDLALWPLDFVPVRQVSSHLFRRGRSFRPSDDKEVEDFGSADLELEGGIAVHLTCSWGQPLGCDALIRAIYHGDRGAAEFRNLDGSFFDFSAEHYEHRERYRLCGPPDDWAGRALLDWIHRLALSNRFAANAEEILRVAEVIDAIYSAPSARSFRSR